MKCIQYEMHSENYIDSINIHNKNEGLNESVMLVKFISSLALSLKGNARLNTNASNINKYRGANFIKSDEK